MCFLFQELICEHEIRNIHCACQDADDLTHFAYITKDHPTQNHFCHVFCVPTMVSNKGPCGSWVIHLLMLRMFVSG